MAVWPGVPPALGGLQAKARSRSDAPAKPKDRIRSTRVRARNPLPHTAFRLLRDSPFAVMASAHPALTRGERGIDDPALVAVHTLEPSKTRSFASDDNSNTGVLRLSGVLEPLVFPCPDL